jgi:hypothetical protein
VSTALYTFCRVACDSRKHPCLNNIPFWPIQLVDLLIFQLSSKSRSEEKY